MAHQISVSDVVFERLKRLAEPFIDREPEDVLRRLLDHYESTLDDPAQSKTAIRLPAPHENLSPISRAPRERGTIVQIGDKKIEAISLRALYAEALKLFVERYSSKLKSVVPLKTSSQRYLIALKPIHPSGKSFFKPVDFNGFYMESHKDYRNGIAHLRILCARLGLAFKYLG